MGSIPTGDAFFRKNAAKIGNVLPENATRNHAQGSEFFGNSATIFGNIFLENDFRNRGPISKIFR